jgi:predicted kinase
VRSDAVRKELVAVPDGTPTAAAFGEGIYRPEVTARTYAECLRRAEQIIFEGGRVIVDASFGEEKYRRMFLNAGAAMAIPATFVLCEVSPKVAKARLQSRRGDVSDADWSVYWQAAQCWQPFDSDTRLATYAVETSDSPERVIDRAVKHLCSLNLCK